MELGFTSETEMNCDKTFQNEIVNDLSTQGRTGTALIIYLQICALISFNAPAQRYVNLSYRYTLYR